ncbi:PIN domain-containing protein [Scheffersomyces amazonensis]|uniref:PIN domain-containing protein n=1 Tax=Scheffersomyces amazonensis TaxID=1078765 RepID=UPI00315D48C6
MSLPSKYAPGGISPSDEHRTVTTGTPRARKPINYTIRVIEDRIEDAVQHSQQHHHHHHQNHYQNQNQNHYQNHIRRSSDDIEMVGMDDYKEVDVISEFVNYSRGSGDLVYSDSMDGIEHYSTQVEVIEGNVSYMVIDTNFILSHLNILDQMKNLAHKYGLKMIIPIAVMQELDGLKNSTRNVSESEDRISGKSVGHLARWANDWIFSQFAKNSTVVQGQNLRQRIDKSTLQDDAILDCCLWWKQNHPKSLVVLFSNDKNFCMKALANHILTVSFRKDMTAELIAKVIHDENVRIFGELKSETVHRTQVIAAEPPIISPAEPSDEWKDATKSIIEFSSFSEVAFRVHYEIQTVTLSAIHHCMENEYGEDLDLLRDYDKNSIVTLYDCSQVFIRFWFTVFQACFKKLPNKLVPFEEDGHGRNSIKTPIHVDIPTDPK